MSKNLKGILSLFCEKIQDPVRQRNRVLSQNLTQDSSTGNNGNNGNNGNSNSWVQKGDRSKSLSTIEESAVILSILAELIMVLDAKTRVTVSRSRSQGQV